MTAVDGHRGRPRHRPPPRPRSPVTCCAAWSGSPRSSWSAASSAGASTAPCPPCSPSPWSPPTSPPPPPSSGGAPARRPTALMIAVMGGYVVRLGAVLGVLWLACRTSPGSRWCRWASPCSPPTSASSSGRPATSRSRSPSPGSSPGLDTEDVRSNRVRHRVPTGQPRHRVARAPPRGHALRGQQGRPADVDLGAHRLRLRVPGRPQLQAGAPGRCRTSASRSTTSSRTASSCRPWAPTASSTRRSWARCSSSSSSATSGASSPSPRCR